MRINNPFIVEGYAGEEYFCDRVKESDDLSEQLHNERNVILYGPRRMGKSGLIHHVFSKTASSVAKCYYVDIMNTWSLKEFVEKFASVVMGSDGEVFMGNVIKILGHLRPTFSVSVLTGLPSISLDIPEGGEEAVLETLFGFLRSQKGRIYIAHR